MASALKDLKLVPSGYRAILKSDGVKSLLDGQGSKACAKCNAMFSLSRLSITPSSSPYAYKVVTRGYTAAAKVYTNSYFGYLDNLHHNTLKKGCGV